MYQKSLKGLIATKERLFVEIVDGWLWVYSGHMGVRTLRCEGELKPVLEALGVPEAIEGSGAVKRALSEGRIALERCLLTDGQTVFFLRDGCVSSVDAKKLTVCEKDGNVSTWVGHRQEFGVLIGVNVMDEAIRVLMPIRPSDEFKEQICKCASELAERLKVTA